MSMHRIAEFLSWNKALNGGVEEQRWLAVPEKSFRVRYQLWQSHSDSKELYEIRSGNRARNGLMGRFML